MRETLRAPLAGQNEARSSKYAERPMSCFVLRKSPPALAEKKSSEGVPAAGKTSRVPISFHESDRWSWAPLFRETRRVKGSGEKALRRGTCQ